MDNSQKIINKIENEKLRPIPKYHYTLRTILVWLAFALFILIGAISFSVILYTVQQSSFELLTHMNHSKIEFLLVLFPIVWLVSLLLFIMASMWAARYSKKAYKIKPHIWLLYTTAISIVLGSLFFITGGANWFEQNFANTVEIYRSLEEKKVMIWSTPEDGNLSGSIYKIQGDSLYINDFNGENWTILIKDAFIAPMVLLEKGELIKINGSIKEKSVFEASDIRPWGGRNFNFDKKSERKGKGGRNRN